MIDIFRNEHSLNIDSNMLYDSIFESQSLSKDRFESWVGRFAYLLIVSSMHRKVNIS